MIQCSVPNYFFIFRSKLKTLHFFDITLFFPKNFAKQFFIMEDNTSVWDYYQQGFVHPGYVPYLHKIVTDKWGNKVKINEWERQGSPSMVAPELVRRNKGMTFQRMFETDPCPPGWTKVPGNTGYCVQKELKHEPVFYTDKAFIAKRQYWRGYTDGTQAEAESRSTRRISEQTDLRSVNPLTGQYTIYYKPVESAANTRYTPPVPPPGKFDQTWNLERDRKFQPLDVKDSYLG